MDSKKKSILKTISWRIIAVLTSLLIIFFYTQKFAISLKITIVAAIVSTIEYYIHERAWKRIK